MGGSAIIVGMDADARLLLGRSVITGLLIYETNTLVALVSPPSSYIISPPAKANGPATKPLSTCHEDILGIGMVYSVSTG